MKHETLLPIENSEIRYGLDCVAKTPRCGQRSPCDSFGVVVVLVTGCIQLTFELKDLSIDRRSMAFDTAPPINTLARSVSLRPHGRQFTQLDYGDANPATMLGVAIACLKLSFSPELVNAVAEWQALAGVCDRR
jgi:hypothetical protein